MKVDVCIIFIFVSHSLEENTAEESGGATLLPASWVIDIVMVLTELNCLFFNFWLLGVTYSGLSTLNSWRVWIASLERCVVVVHNRVYNIAVLNNVLEAVFGQWTFVVLDSWTDFINYNKHENWNDRKTITRKERRFLQNWKKVNNVLCSDDQCERGKTRSTEMLTMNPIKVSSWCVM